MYHKPIKQLKHKQINIFEAKSKFEKLKSKFFDFVVNVDARQCKELDKIYDIYIVDALQNTTAYNPETGL